MDFLLYLFLTQVLQVNYQHANFLSVSAGILNNFGLNVRFNFKTFDRLWTRLGSFFAVGMLGWGISAVCLFTLIEKIHLHTAWAKLLTIGIVTIVQFTLNNYFSFRKTKC